MQRADFNFHLPPDLIAQRPIAERSASRLLTLDGESGDWQDRIFRELPTLLGPQDLLVFNDTRVVPARVHGSKDSGGRIEILLERAESSDTALVHARASKGLRPGAIVNLPGGVTATMLGREGALFRLRFSQPVLSYLEAHGSIPLPPYIDREPDRSDASRYQTVFARDPGAVAAPTAGLHFDEMLLKTLAERGVQHAFVTLHVGAGTFQPLRVDDIEAHEMHPEYFQIPAATATRINATHAAGGRVIAVGTTVVRSLEAAAAGAAPAAAGTRTQVSPLSGFTSIFIKPGAVFRVVDAIVTNFHLPESTLLMLCSAFVGREHLLRAYAHAVARRYRFFSYGDAMYLSPMWAAVERP